MHSVFGQLGCKQLQVAEVMAVSSEAVVVRLAACHHQMEKLGTYVVESNVLEVPLRQEVEKTEIVEEEPKLTE